MHGTGIISLEFLPSPAEHGVQRGMQLVSHQCNLIQFVKAADGLGEPDVITTIPALAKLCTVRRASGSLCSSFAFQYDCNGEVEMFVDEQFHHSISFK